jgi:FlaA1/EpsC-like NDP-sugar epimerase
MSAKPLEGKRVLVLGGTGSVGKVLLHRMLTEELGCPEEIVIFSRDEAKQHYMRLALQRVNAATDEVIYKHQGRVRFVIGDIRDLASVNRALGGVHIVFSAAALKQVPTCEYFPFEAVRTNVEGVQNVVRAIHENKWPVEALMGISTDKAVKPVNVMGMTKAIQERVVQSANMLIPQTRSICVRYGNVLASRGSAIPLFHDQIRHGGPVTITLREMTRFFLTLNDAVDTIFAALKEAKPGETYIPRVPSAKMIDVAQALIGGRKIDIKLTGIRPGEKIHEILISEEEVMRTHDRGKYYAISSILPEVHGGSLPTKPPLSGEYSSANSLMTPDEVRSFLERRKLLDAAPAAEEEELLR